MLETAMQYIPYVGFLIALVPVAMVGLWLITLRRVVPTNMVHIVQSRKVTASYGKGKDAGNVYYEWPAWMPVIGVTVSRFPESVFDISLTNYEAYDSGRLPFIVDIKAFFRIHNSDMAANRVASFDELKNQLQAVLQGAVRRVLGTEKLELIMEDRSNLGNKFTAEVDNQLKEWGVTTVKSIEFMDIRDARDSSVIADIMAKEQSRIQKESRITVAENFREAELKEIDARRTVDVQKQDAEQKIGLRTAEKEREVGIANEQARQQIQVEAKITAERNLEVARVEHVRAAEIAKDVAEVEAEKEKNVQIISAEASKSVAVVSAEGEKQSTITLAEGNLASAQLNARGIEAEGVARGVAEKAILMAPVESQITLAKEIGENMSYQNYLITIRQVEAGQVVGIEMAKAMQGADLKVIANAGDVQGGIAQLGDVFTTKGGMGMTGMLAALAQTEEGKALVGRITGSNSI